MARLISERAVARVVRAAFANLGEDVRRLREDAGVSRAELARASGVDPSFLARIEAGTAHPSLETCAQLGVSLGADLATRLYPTTGPLVRDRHQLAIAESLLPILHPTWQPFLEVAVRRPSRGWIDLALHNRTRAVIAAVEIQSELRRVEQVIRWSEEKARSLPSWDGWGRLGGEPSISRLLIVRSTRTTRTIQREFGRVLRTAYPAHPEDALAALVDGDVWPGPTMLWAVEADGVRGRYRIVARP